MKDPILSLNKKDFELQFFRAGGKGGQKQNKTSSACRIIHKESGAVGECRNHREQPMNKKEAFERLIASTKFQVWLNRKIHEINTGKTPEERVEDLMRDKNLKIEMRSTDGEWITYTECIPTNNVNTGVVISHAEYK
jgi:peptide chain release factor 2